jgi:hypothetical protein
MNHYFSVVSLETEQRLDVSAKYNKNKFNRVGFAALTAVTPKENILEV